MPRIKKSAKLIADQEKLIATLKFTPCTYRISLYGYGGEIVMGTVDRTIYDYFRQRRLDVSCFAWDSDYAEENNIPEEMWWCPPGSWYECDNIAHTNGVDRNSGTLIVEDENGDVVFQKELEDITWDDDNPEWECCSESYINEQPEGTVVFVGSTGDKGTFFEGEIELTSPFDPAKLVLQYEEVDGNEIIHGVMYDGVDIDNCGGDTTGKSSSFAFFVPGTNKEGSLEKYSTADDCTYEMTEWFPRKINPVREGLYEIQGGSKDKWPFGETTTARWTGKNWVSTWGSDNAEEIKIKQWRGISHDPNTI